MGKKFMFSDQRGRGARESRSRSAPQDINRMWPELRVTRFPDIDAGLDTDSWHIFLDDIGGPRNYGKGKARALGSMAINYISAKEFGLMLEARYGDSNDYSTPEKAARLIAKMRRGIGDFIRDAQKEAYDNRTEAIVDRVSSIIVGSSLDVDNELASTAATTGEMSMFEADIVDTVTAGQSAPIWFSPAELAVNGLGHYGEGYGLDLSMNPVLYDERMGILEYLRTYERLNTVKYTNAGWIPHATVFELEQHIRSTTIAYGEPLPESIAYNHPIAL